MTLNFEVIGIDDITTDPTVRFKCSTNDGHYLYVGSESTTASGHVWKYANGSWSRITGDLASQGFKSVNSILYSNGTLFAGTGKDYLSFGFGQVWANSGEGWINTNLQGEVSQNILIRKILKVGNDIFAAGSIGSLWKYNTSSWDQVANPFVSNIPTGYTPSNLYNWVDLETDGQNLYGTTIALTLSPVSGVVKYDGNSIINISEKDFSSVDNYLITKLCWHNNKLYAGTYNEKGCEIWRYASQSWSKISDSGFGSRNNYKVIDIKAVDGNILVSVENPTGGQIWRYSEGTGWEKILFNSEIKYTSYLIESFSNKNILVGTQKMSLLPASAEVQVYSSQTRADKLLNYWPDGQFSTFAVSSGKYRSFGPNAFRTVVTEGTLLDPAETVLSPSVTLDATGPYRALYSLDNSVTSLKVQEILELKDSAISGQLGIVFSTGTSGISYFGGGPVYKDDQNNILLNALYTEEGYWVPPSPVGGWVSIARLTVSFDEGLTWYDCGNIISSRAVSRPSEYSQFSSTVQITPVSLFKKDDYLYVHYINDWMTSSISDVNYLCVARAPYSEVIASALNKEVSNWQKYCNGSFSQPGLGGSSTELIDSFILPVNRAGVLAYSTQSNKNFFFFRDSVKVFDSNLYWFKPGIAADSVMITSEDGLNFGYPQRLSITNAGGNYNSIIGPSSHYGIINDQSYLYTTSGVWSDGWRAASLARLSLSSISELNKNRAYSVEEYNPLIFQVIGTDEITTEPTLKFRCSTGDDDRIFVGSDDVNSQGNIWQYKNNSWTRITENFPSTLQSINSILIKNKKLYVGTGGKYLEYGKGQVWENYGEGWKNTGLQFPATFNILIRKLLAVGDDVYAAGTVGYAYKLSNNQWSPVFDSPSVTLFNFVDLETDGTNVYASIAGADANQYSGVFEYDGSSWNQISTKDFGVSSNQLITKLCYHNDKLYAGTFNQVSGCQIWEYTTSTNSWQQINQNGFGSIGNYKVFDLKSINGSLIASVENHTGGTVWVYDTTFGWVQEPIVSNTKYSSYLIQFLSPYTYLIGTEKMSVIPETNSTVLYERSTLESSGMDLFCDASFNATEYIGNNEYRFVGVNGYNIVVFEGELDDPIKRVLSPLSSLPSLQTYNISAARWQPILDKKPDALSGQHNQVFELNVSRGWEMVSGIAYWGGGVTYKDDASGVVLYFYHTEEGYWDIPVTGAFLPGGWDGDIRMAVSLDQGVSFYDCGSVLKSNYGATPPSINPIQIETFAGVRKVGDYLYGYYWSDTSGPLTENAIPLCLARAPYEEVIQYALNKQVSPNWKKYYNGSFDQPGQKGLASNLFSDYLVPVRKHTNTYYSSSLDMMLNFMVNPLHVMDSNLYVYNFNSSKEDLYVMKSRNGIKFSYPQRITTSLNGYTNYFAILASSTFYGNLDDKFYAYGMTGKGFYTEGDGQPYSKLELSTLPFENINRSFSEGRFNSEPNFKILYKVNNDWQEVIPYSKTQNNWKLSLPFVKNEAGWTKSYPIKQGREEVDLYFYIGDSLGADDSGSAIQFLSSVDYSGLFSSVPNCYTFRTVESPQTTGEFGPFTGYRFEEIRTGINTNPIAPYWFGKAGADIVLFHKLKQQSDRDVYIIKYALGGSRWCKEPGFLDWSPRSSVEDGGDLFRSYIDFLVTPALAVLKDSGKTPIFKGGFITLGTNYPSYYIKTDFTKEQINIDSSGLVSALISSFRDNNINTDSAKIVWIAPDRVRLKLFADAEWEEPYKSAYLEYLDATVSAALNLSTIFSFASGYDPSAWASLSNTGDYGHPSTSGHIKIGETVFNNFFYTGP